jgi:hypothetical protein
MATRRAQVHTSYTAGPPVAARRRRVGGRATDGGDGGDGGGGGDDGTGGGDGRGSEGGGGEGRATGAAGSGAGPQLPLLLDRETRRTRRQVRRVRRGAGVNRCPWSPPQKWPRQGASSPLIFCALPTRLTRRHSRPSFGRTASCSRHQVPAAAPFATHLPFLVRKKVVLPLSC